MSGWEGSSNSVMMVDSAWNNRSSVILEGVVTGLERTEKQRGRLEREDLENGMYCMVLCCIVDLCWLFVNFSVFRDCAYYVGSWNQIPGEKCWDRREKLYRAIGIMLRKSLAIYTLLHYWHHCQQEPTGCTHKLQWSLDCCHLCWSERIEMLHMGVLACSPADICMRWCVGMCGLVPQDTDNLRKEICSSKHHLDVSEVNSGACCGWFSRRQQNLEQRK